MIKHRRMAGTIATALITVVALSGCSKKAKTVIESIADIQKREGVPVTVTVAAQKTLESVVRYGGTVEGYAQSELFASLPATVDIINAQVGQQVEKDAVLMHLAPYYASQLKMATAQYEATQKAHDRTKALAEQGAVPQEAMDQLETGLTAAQMGLDGARKSENVTAPFGGTIVALTVAKGELVSPGTSLLTIASLGRVRVKLTISEAIIRDFKLGQRAILTLTNDSTIIGSVEKVSMAGDAKSHTFTVETVFENRGNVLKPGMYLPVSVVTGTHSNAVALPQDAVIAEGSDKHVYLVENGLARKTDVVLGIRSGDEYEALLGVPAGAQVITSGMSMLADSIKVKVIQ